MTWGCGWWWWCASYVSQLTAIFRCIFWCGCVCDAMDICVCAAIGTAWRARATVRARAHGRVLAAGARGAQQAQPPPGPVPARQAAHAHTPAHLVCHCRDQLDDALGHLIAGGRLAANHAHAGHHLRGRGSGGGWVSLLQGRRRAGPPGRRALGRAAGPRSQRPAWIGWTKRISSGGALPLAAAAAAAAGRPAPNTTTTTTTATTTTHLLPLRRPHLLDAVVAVDDAQHVEQLALVLQGRGGTGGARWGGPGGTGRTRRVGWRQAG